MKYSIKRILPLSVKRKLKVLLYSYKLIPEYWYWFKKDVSQNSQFSCERSDLSSLMIISHVLEKGITMPGRRLGFGYERVRDLIRSTKQSISKYTENHVEIQSTLKDLEQYLRIHEQGQFSLPNDIQNGITDLLRYKNIDTKECFNSTPQELFKKTSNFLEFAHSRHTVRWYSNKRIENEVLIKVFELASTAPSACNRQSTKVYVIDDKEKKDKVLKLQNGNRGFGILADKILLITSDMRCWSFETRTSAFLDAGIFTQNLLYALHYYEICACTLNAHLTIHKRKELQELIGYTDSEIPIVFVSIGRAPENFMIAGSQRLNVEQIYKFV